MEEKSWNNEVLIAPIRSWKGKGGWGLAEGLINSLPLGLVNHQRSKDLDPKPRKKKSPKFGRLQLAIFHNRLFSESLIKIKAYINYLSLCPSRTFKVNFFVYSCIIMNHMPGIICQELKRYVAMWLDSWEKFQRNLSHSGPRLQGPFTDLFSKTSKRIWCLLHARCHCRCWPWAETNKLLRELALEGR